ncbi:MAG: PDZ domain-containing protein [Vampirovibrionales bacterium]|nr:PDZ domain-containing protein [Vampirovibrionales bacterium]
MMGTIQKSLLLISLLGVMNLTAVYGLTLSGRVNESVPEATGYLGIHIRVPMGAELYHLPVSPWIESVEPNSPSARAGVQAGDVIVGVNHKPVAGLDRRQLDAIIGNRVGEVVELHLQRASQSLTIPVRVE